nr:TauD/TfdA family dioxygenase [Thiorhodococcus mannitoliphagus]
MALHPAGIEGIAVEMNSLAQPSAAELAAVRQRVAAYNVALIRTRPANVSPQSVILLGRALSLIRTDANLLADAQAVSWITPAPLRTEDGGATTTKRADFIPYTSKPLSWHTDGYYNAPQEQVLAWTLFCVRPARAGGINSLLDPEIAYIRLRDASRTHIEALTHPKALRIPAHEQDGKMLRPLSTGPVFSIREGHLHMRYSARGKNVIWRSTTETDAARDALTQLFSTGDAFTLNHRLEAGEGFVSNNVLHNRSAFAEAPGDASQRLLYRVRYLDRIQ